MLNLNNTAIIQNVHKVRSDMIERDTGDIVATAWVTDHFPISVGTCLFRVKMGNYVFCTNDTPPDFQIWYARWLCLTRASGQRVASRLARKKPLRKQKKMSAWSIQVKLPMLSSTCWRAHAMLRSVTWWFYQRNLIFKQTVLASFYSRDITVPDQSGRYNQASWISSWAPRPEFVVFFRTLILGFMPW